jgi:phage virion morphogenesis protein
MSDLKITTETAALSATFFRAGNVGVDIPAVLAEMGGALVSATQDRFRSETGPGGVKWKPLSPRYLDSKRKRKSSHPSAILRLTGNMDDSINYQVGGSILEVGTNRFYAPIHQFGGVINVPARAETRTRTYKVKFVRVGKRGQPLKKLGEVDSRVSAKRVKVGAHTVIIPARPFLDVRLVEDMPRLTEILDREIRKKLALPEAGDGRGA